MPSLRPAFWFIAVYGLTVPAGLPAAAPPMDTLLPKTTVGFVSATNSIRLTEQWSKTQLGKLMDDPVMKPFKEDFRAQMQAQWATLAERLGVHLDDLRGVATGEASLALLDLPPRAKGGDIRAATSLLLDVTGNLPKAKALLAKARAGLKGSGAQETIEQIEGTTVYVFAVPLPQARQAAAGRGGAAAAAAAATGQTVYFLTESLFGACDDLEVVRDILARLANANAAGSLSRITAYRMVMKRCAADAPDHVPSIRWFIYPLGYAEATRAATPPEKWRKGKTIVEIIRNQGYGAFQGVGGYVDVAADGYQIIHRSAVYAPPPYTESMKMFVLPNGNDFSPQPWVNRDITAYFTVYVDILNAFDNFGPLYDEIIGGKGLWKETLEGMEKDPGGPQINLRKELIEHLGQRVTMISDYILPITTTSERLLWAIEIKGGAAGEAAVAKAVEKCVKNDDTIKKRVVAGHVVWEIEEEATTGMPDLRIDVPSLTPKKDDAKPKPDEKDDEEKEGHFLPHGAFTVANGHLFIASHIDFLKKIIEPLEKNRRLATQAEFQKVWNVSVNVLGVKEQSSRSFAWTDRAVQPAYELIRQGKMPQSESLLGRTLNSLLAPGKKGSPRHQRIDGSKLPDFGVVSKALGPSTAAMVSEPNGWFVKGVLMTK